MGWVEKFSLDGRDLAKHKGSIWASTWRAGNDYPVIRCPIQASVIAQKQKSTTTLPELTLYAIEGKKHKNAFAI